MLGEIIAILCAVSWSLSVILLKISGARVHPLALNVIKNGVGLVCLIATALIWEGGWSWPSWQSTAILLLSGFLGIGIADGLVLRSMQLLHASQVAALETLFAPFVILLSMIFWGEKPNLAMVGGGALILLSVLFVSPKAKSSSERLPFSWQGTLLISLGLFLIALGIVMIKGEFSQVPLFSLVAIRMLAGFLGSLLVFGLSKERWTDLLDFWQAPHKTTLAAACLMSSYVSILLWVAGYKYLEASVAALLNQTATLFTVLFAVVFLKEKLTRQHGIGIILALAGAIIIALARQEVLSGRG